MSEVKIKVSGFDESTNTAYVDSEDVYDALSELNNLVEIRPNVWVNNQGDHYVQTKLGFGKMKKVKIGDYTY